MYKLSVRYKDSASHQSWPLLSDVADEVRRVMEIQGFVSLALSWEAPKRVEPDNYKAWYEEAMGASNEAGFAGISAAETIRTLDAQLTAALIAQIEVPGPLSAEAAKSEEAGLLCPCGSAACEFTLTQDEVTQLLSAQQRRDAAAARERERMFRCSPLSDEDAEQRRYRRERERMQRITSPLSDSVTKKLRS